MRGKLSDSEQHLNDVRFELMRVQQIFITKLPPQISSGMSHRWLYAWSLAFAGPSRSPMKDMKKPQGGRPGVTLDDVRAACACLEKQGRVVTAVNVRLELGRGSFTTLQRHLRTLGNVSPGSRPHKKA